MSIFDSHREPPPPAPEHVEAVERIRGALERERRRVRELIDDALERDGEVCSSGVVHLLERLEARTFDRAERSRAIRIVREELRSAAASGALRIREARREGSLLVRNYYERVRAPGRDG